jgi:hypothetical protein
MEVPKMAALKVEIESRDVELFSGNSKTTGKPYAFYKQTAHVFLDDSKYPKQFEITHDNEHEALAEGEYLLDLNQAARIDRFGGLVIDTRKLVFVPAKPSPRPAAASQQSAPSRSS